MRAHLDALAPIDHRTHHLGHHLRRTPAPPCPPAKPSESPGRRYSAPPAAPRPRPTHRHTDCRTPSKRRPPSPTRCLRPCATPPPAPRCSPPPTGSGSCFRNVSLIEYGNPSVRTASVASARSAPFSFTTMPMISTSSAGRVRQIQPLQHVFAVGHLRHRPRRHKRHRIDLLEPRRHQRPQILRLGLGRNLPRQSLPRIARTLHDLHCVLVITRSVVCSCS